MPPLAASVGEIRLHNLRHGHPYADESDASLAEPMSRMGALDHAGARVYLHARRERDREIASMLDEMVKREPEKAKKEPTTADGAEERSGT